MEMSRTGFDPRRICAVTFGLLLWLQLAAGTLTRELEFPDAEPQRVVVYFLPLVLLVLVTSLRNLVISLLLFPASFGWVLVVTPRSHISGAVTSPWSFVFVALTLIGYVLAASAWLRTPPTGAPYLYTKREPIRVKQDRWRPYRGIFAPRIALLVAVFIVSAAILPLSPDLVERVARAFAHPADPDSIERGIILCNLMLFFAWCGLAYWLFFLPSIGIEDRVRHLETKLQATIARARRSQRRVFVRIGVLVIVAIAAGFCLLEYT